MYLLIEPYEFVTVWVKSTPFTLYSVRICTSISSCASAIWEYTCEMWHVFVLFKNHVRLVRVCIIAYEEYFINFVWDVYTPVAALRGDRGNVPPKPGKIPKGWDQLPQEPAHLKKFLKIFQIFIYFFKKFHWKFLKISNFS